MKPLRWVGKDTPRPDTRAKAAGQAYYIHDLARPGMLFGKIKFSDHAHARIVGIDTSRAEKIPGVKAVLTGYNTPEVRIGFLKDNFALKKDKVRQFRDEVAAVAATDPEIAAEAVERIVVEYEPLPGVFTPEDALREDAPLVHETDARGIERNSNRMDIRFRHATGDLDRAKRASSFVAEGTFSTQWMQQSCMGTAGCIAEFDPNDNLTLWAKTQIPFLAQRDFNGALAAIGLKGKNSRVIVPALGGGFGTGLDTHAYEYISILLARRTGRPVKILYTREEEFANLSPRQSCTVRIAQGCDEEGRLTFRDVHVLQDNGAYTSWGITYPSVMMLPATSLYKVPVVHFDTEFVYTNNTYCQAMRGYGNPELNWALESNLDELAAEAGVDPLEIRRINCNEPGETTPMGLKITTCGLRECIEASAGKLGWNGKQREQGKKRGKARGIGIASLMHVGGSGRIYRSDGSGVMMRLDDFGNVYVHAGGVEMGQGHHSALSLIVAESLGVTPDKVHIVQTDTATCPWDVGTHASRGAFTGGNAAILAAEKLRGRIFELAEKIAPAEFARNLEKYKRQHPGYEPPDFDWKAAAVQDRFELAAGVLHLKDAPNEPWLRLPFDRFLRAIHFRDGGEVLMASAFYEPPTQLPDWEKGYGNLSANYAFGAQAVEVEVDRDTGDVTILHVASAHDVGRVLNPQTLKGQIYGGLAQGIGYALYEEIRSEKGRIRNPNFTDYKIPTAAEMNFPIDLTFIETNDPSGPFGAKGVGEPGMCPTAPAIANAVYDALGVRIRDLPITPEKILAALNKSDPI